MKAVPRTRHAVSASTMTFTQADVPSHHETSCLVMVKDKQLSNRTAILPVGGPLSHQVLLLWGGGSVFEKRHAFTILA